MDRLLLLPVDLGVQDQLLWLCCVGNCPSLLHVPGILWVQEEDAYNIVFEWLQSSGDNARYFLHKSSPSVLALCCDGGHDGALFPGEAREVQVRLLQSSGLGERSAPFTVSLGLF